MESETVFQDLSKFVVKRKLSDSSQRKVICLEGKFQDKEDISVLLLEKKAFTEENVKLLCTDKSILKKEFVNDAYGSYEVLPQTELNGIKATIIHPATEQHIKKFQRARIYIVEETEEIYNTVTLPCITESQFSLQWVYNILEHISEVDRIVYENPDKEHGFILVPDLKWDGKQFETLYLLAICNKRDIKSLRDLTAEHIPLLTNILNEGSEAIEKKYGLKRTRLRVYFHYPPSFYHLHIHFKYIDFEAPGINFERAHSLVSVINNLKVKSDYYQKSPLLFSVRETDTLFQKYKEKGIITESEGEIKPVENDKPNGAEVPNEGN